jgi:hypothetical protein
LSTQCDSGCWWIRAFLYTGNHILMCLIWPCACTGTCLQLANTTNAQPVTQVCTHAAWRCGIPWTQIIPVCCRPVQQSERSGGDACARVLLYVYFCVCKCVQLVTRA